MTHASDTPTPRSQPSPADAQPATGLRVLGAAEFSLHDAVGGIRGLVEALAPGLVFVVVYLLTFELTPTLVASLGVAVLLVLARLLQRTPVTQAFSGLAGVAIGVVWAWRSGDASDYFLLGLLTNGAYLAACLVSLAVRWPVVGLVVELFRRGFAEAAGRDKHTQDEPTAAGVAADAPTPAEAQVLAGGSEPASDTEEAPQSLNPFAGFSAWRREPVMRRYMMATWLWVALFGIRLAVQVPLYLGTEVAWLGAARLAMGIPLWALTLWGTWILVRRPADA